MVPRIIVITNALATVHKFVEGSGRILYMQQHLRVSEFLYNPPILLKWEEYCNSKLHFFQAESTTAAIIPSTSTDNSGSCESIGFVMCQDGRCVENYDECVVIDFIFTTTTTTSKIIYETCEAFGMFKCPDGSCTAYFDECVMPCRNRKRCGELSFL